MANLADLKKVADELTPVLKELFDLAAQERDKTDKRTERSAVQRLKKLVSEAGNPTRASLEERAGAIGSVRSALTETLTLAASSAQPLPQTTVDTIQAQRNALRNAFGLLLERAAFEDIPQLLPAGKIDQISKQLDKAEEEIEERAEAKRILDTTVKVLLTAASIAVKLA